MRLKRIVAAAAVAAGVVLSAVTAMAGSRGAMIRNLSSEPGEAARKAGWTLRVDSVMTRDDVTRLYATLLGPANRAGRIDSVSAAGHEATDIDGVDFKRWFQWEEDGVVSLEIDFPPSFRPVARSPWSISAATDRGKLVWNVK